MNVVLYTYDFEPITVINIPQEILDYVEKRGEVRLALQEPISVENPDLKPDTTPMRIVHISAGRLRWFNGDTKIVLMTRDEELAMLLKPDWLSGQRGTINAYTKTIRNLTESLVRAMRGNMD